jgi:poly(3-hydroxybutyrate) depolymerase
VRAAIGLLVAVLLTAVLLAAGCGGASNPPARRAAKRPVSACADRLPLDTLLRVPDGPSRPRPLILALHGARQSGYGLQSYTGFTDDAPGFLVAYPNTPHDNGF